jgi:hypothetical protein
VVTSRNLLSRKFHAFSSGPERLFQEPDLDSLI